MSISILLQRLITLLCTSHTRQCAPSLKWYKIHMVQPVPPVTLGCWGTPVGGERDRHKAEGRPWGADARGQEPGSGQAGRQEAAPASGSQGLPSCAAMGDATRGEAELGELSAQAASSPPGARGCSPAPATSPPSVAVQRCCIPRRCPGPSPGAGENAAPARQQERCAGRKRLKKKWNQEPGAKTGPPSVSVSYRIKTSISAPARATSGRERREGVAGRVCAP